MSKERELLNWALIFLHPNVSEEASNLHKEITELLAQPEQEPVAWVYKRQNGDFTERTLSFGFEENFDGVITPLYTVPQTREPLSEATIEHYLERQGSDFKWESGFLSGVAWAEKAHGIGSKMGETFETYKECSECVDKVKGVNLSTLKLHGSAATETFNAEVDKILAQADALKAEGFNWDKAPIICELNGYRWHLGPESPEPLAWESAVEWCKSVGGELPPRDVLFLASLNQDADWFRGQPYWSSTKHGAANAWGQYFGNSSQYYDAKTTDYYVRAVRKVLI